MQRELNSAVSVRQVVAIVVLLFFVLLPQILIFLFPTSMVLQNISTGPSYMIYVLVTTMVLAMIAALIELSIDTREVKVTSPWIGNAAMLGVLVILLLLNVATWIAFFDSVTGDGQMFRMTGAALAFHVFWLGASCVSIVKYRIRPVAAINLSFLLMFALSLLLFVIYRWLFL